MRVCWNECVCDADEQTIGRSWSNEMDDSEISFNREQRISLTKNSPGSTRRASSTTPCLARNGSSRDSASHGHMIGYVDACGSVRGGINLGGSGRMKSESSGDDVLGLHGIDDDIR